MTQALRTDSIIDSDEVPSITLGLLTGTHPDAERAPGIFTKEDLFSIKLYVKKGLALPTTRPVVESYLGYSKVGIAGLEPADIQGLFTAINGNCMKWDDVEKSCIQQCLNLDSAAENITDTGDALLRYIEQMPLMEKIKTTLGQLSAQQLAQITYTNEDREASSALGEILEEMKKDIDSQQKKTAEVKRKVSDFRIELAGGKLSDGNSVPGLEPQVKSKKNLMDRNNLSQTIERLQQDIDTKKSRIEQLQKDYEKYVGLAFSGAPGGIIGLAITGGIFGKKAEDARKEKNREIAALRALEDQISGKKALQSAIENLSRDFSDMGIRMVDAEMALNNLDFMWQNILSKINESKESFSKINDALKLTQFIISFSKVIKPWRNIGESARDLNRLFNEALAEYKKLYGNS
ncbi:alpha-xenorhabdolysin family binary toxin subunit A [Massilia sp. W12]|uniref:alpha-xenorhabdolysin family binary toxin subunit A n=1 Tax=Massilia sp. W12 TaxID=3126507 RepID=UPI0030D048DE